MQIFKFSASGNDFVIFDDFDKKIKDYSNLAKKICNRFNGVGADGMIVVLKDDKFDFSWEFYNSDGSRAKMCGNGARSVILFAKLNNIINKNSAKFKTDAGIIEGKILNFLDKNIANVCVKLPNPKKLSDDFKELNFLWHFYDTGVPHLVTFVDDLNKFDLEICKKLRKKYDANVNFAKINNDEIFIRTFERGVEGETLSCGTGMAACFWANYNLNNKFNKMKLIPKNKDILHFEILNNTIQFYGIVKNTFIANYFLT